MRKAIALFTLTLLLALPAHAGLYLGANLAQATYEEDGFDSVEPTALVLRLGNELTPNLAIEGRLGVGLTDDTVDVFGIDVDVEIDNFFGVYVRGILPLDTVSLYGLVGYTDGKLTGSANGISVSASESDVSYGIGADIAVSKTGAINVEWAQLLSESTFDVTALSVGYKHSF